MKEDEMLICLIAFVLGYLVSRMMRGNGMMVGAPNCADAQFFDRKFWPGGGCDD